MDEILEEFENYVTELKAERPVNNATGVDGERARLGEDELVQEYRAKLRAEESPSRGRELLQRFRQEVARL